MHRDPDDQGTFHTDWAAIGMRRLYIIDVAGGHQPGNFVDGSYPSAKILDAMAPGFSRLLELVPHLVARFSVVLSMRIFYAPNVS